MPKKEDEIGALWVKSSASGDYLTGTINGVQVVVFANTYKTTEKQPAWRGYKSTPREQ